ncbi:MAG: protein kinase [Gemmatimonadales bacterium]|nr:protein kinase [Gemmatimonadales bacterium]NIP08574.1 protein kinase [Gemmatimonadales bacterium]NIQ99111.1 protein kinase [Gemmatimonadales bacterium]NIS66081.1 protein kinase [Gemmatimonadales bacterium]
MAESSGRKDDVHPVGATILETRDGPGLWSRRYLPAVVTFVVGAALSFVAHAVLAARQSTLQRAAFERRTAEVAHAAEQGFILPVEVLASVPALFEASVEVSRSEFRVFTAGALQRRPGIYALEWLPLVPADQRAAYEAAARADGLAGFEFKEDRGDGAMVRADERPFYLPIYYMEPPNPTPLGFDVASEAPRFAPVEKAMLTGAAVASPRIRLVEDEPSIYSIAVFHPVYRIDRPTSTSAERRRTFRGVAAEVFRVAPMIERALRSVDTEGFDFALIDSAGPPELRLLYESQPGLLDGEPVPGSLTNSVAFPFADRTWALTFIAPPGFAAGSLPVAVLAIGLLLSALAGLGVGAVQTIRQLHHRVEAALKLGPYTLVEKLGEGGMGVVYKARHAMLRRPTAIKLLPPARSSEALLERFEREVQLTSELTHPNTIDIYDYGRTSDGVLYYVMEYVEGISLDRLVETHGPLEASRTVALVTQVCGALAEAHDVGLIHRDVKPANLMICVRGGIYDFVKVLDFGLVKELGEGGSDVTHPDVIMGTPLYMVPEAIQSPDSIGPPADLYALGAVAYYLLTGAPVFEGDNAIELARHHLYSEPLPPSQKTELPIPERFEVLILACLAKRPGDRPTSARALLAELESVVAQPAWTQERAREWWELHVQR